MLKAGTKRRRTVKQIKDQKEEEALRQQSIEEKLVLFEQLQQKYNEAQQEAETGKRATQILGDMINKGEAEMDENGGVRVKPQQIDGSQMSQHSQQQQMQDMSQASNDFQI